MKALQKCFLMIALLMIPAYVVAMSNQALISRGLSFAFIGAIVLAIGAFIIFSGGMGLGIVPGISAAIGSGQLIFTIGAAIIAIGGCMSLTGYVKSKNDPSTKEIVKVNSEMSVNKDYELPVSSNSSDLETNREFIPLVKAKEIYSLKTGFTEELISLAHGDRRDIEVFHDPTINEPFYLLQGFTYSPGVEPPKHEQIKINAYTGEVESKSEPNMKYISEEQVKDITNKAINFEKCPGFRESWVRITQQPSVDKPKFEARKGYWRNDKNGKMGYISIDAYSGKVLGVVDPGCLTEDDLPYR
jgi:hypothetical protein